MIRRSVYVAAMFFSSAMMRARSAAEPSMKPGDWPHHPIFVQAGDNMNALGIKRGSPVPLGVPFEVESDLFKGSVLLRFRNAKSDDPTKHADYFDGRKRLMQTVIQGRFKRPVNMGDVYVGSLFAKPLAGAPPKTMTKIMDAVIRRIAPGLVLDLSSNLPKVIAILAGTAQTMSIDEPGKEPDITSKDIEENVGHILGQKLSTRHKRRKVLSIPSKASKFTFDTHNVYTFHTYDDAMDYGMGTMHIPMYGEYDIKPSIGNQPLSLTAVTTAGEILYDLQIWHEDNLLYV
mmetsp:Transcript_26181/g.59044  ORF Transcript_26181/g.59044 Transcript_26181/m.59044 type:complete len:289 (+) Transcript_26181:278-1144(+)